MEESLLDQACALLEREAKTLPGHALPTTGPLAILLLSMDDAVLDTQVTVGRHLLQVLEPLLDRREQLIAQARQRLLANENAVWESMAREFGSPQSVASLMARTPESVACKGKKKMVQNAFEETLQKSGAISCCPPLVQLVYAKHRHHAHHAHENRTQSKNTWGGGDDDSWRMHLVVPRWEQHLCMQHTRLLHSCKSVRQGNEMAAAPLRGHGKDTLLSIVEVSLFPRSSLPIMMIR